DRGQRRQPVLGPDLGDGVLEQRHRNAGDLLVAPEQLVQRRGQHATEIEPDERRRRLPRAHWTIVQTSAGRKPSSTSPAATTSTPCTRLTRARAPPGSPGARSTVALATVSRSNSANLRNSIVSRCITMRVVSRPGAALAAAIATCLAASNCNMPGTWSRA